LGGRRTIQTKRPSFYRKATIPEEKIDVLKEDPEKNSNGPKLGKTDHTRLDEGGKGNFKSFPG